MKYPFKFINTGITISDPEKSIAFYEDLGYIIDQDILIQDKRLLFLSHSNHQIELIFHTAGTYKKGFSHIAYQYTNSDELLVYLQNHSLQIQHKFPSNSGSLIYIILGPDQEQLVFIP